MRELCNAFVRPGLQPGVPAMMRTYRELAHLLPELQRAAGAADLFEARVFKDLCFVARAKANAIIG